MEKYIKRIAAEATELREIRDRLYNLSETAGRLRSRSDIEAGLRRREGDTEMKVKTEAIADAHHRACGEFKNAADCLSRAAYHLEGADKVLVEMDAEGFSLSVYEKEGE